MGNCPRLASAPFGLFPKLGQPLPKAPMEIVAPDPDVYKLQTLSSTQYLPLWISMDCIATLHCYSDWSLATQFHKHLQHYSISSFIRIRKNVHRFWLF